MTKAITDRPAGGINEAFPYKVCINLDRRPDRWRQMRLKFERHGIQTVRRFPALDGDGLEIPSHWRHTTGAYGCLRSHLEVVSEARRLGASGVFIFEDDVVFDHQFRKKFSARVKELPADWDMLYLGALHKDEPIKVSENIARITEAYSTYAYALRDTVFDAFIELNRKAETVLDNNTLALQKRFNCYCFMPHLAWVETDYSDAQKRLEHHWYLRESLVLFSPQVDRLLSDTTIIFAHGARARGERAAENMTYLVNYYHEFFSPHIAMVIVEQGDEPTVDPATLPANCKYIFLAGAGAFDRGRCFDAGLASSDPARKFVILSDDDIYLETLDIRANLRMCERYDGATGFSKIIDLTREDSLRLRDTKTTRGIDITKNASPINKNASPIDNERRGYCCFFRREAIQTPGGRGETGAEKVESLLSSRSGRQSQVFQSPNHALRLWQG
jgi:GR25 family glycosyltransferase involved in LPS biosynthesis